MKKDKKMINQIENELDVEYIEYKGLIEMFHKKGEALKAQSQRQPEYKQNLLELAIETKEKEISWLNRSVDDCRTFLDKTQYSKTDAGLNKKIHSIKITLFQNYIDLKKCNEELAQMRTEFTKGGRIKNQFIYSPTLFANDNSQKMANDILPNADVEQQKAPAMERRI